MIVFFVGSGRVWERFSGVVLRSMDWLSFFMAVPFSVCVWEAFLDHLFVFLFVGETVVGGWV